MSRAMADKRTARERLHALTPGWTPTLADVDAARSRLEPEAVEPDSASPPRHSLPEAVPVSWRIEGSSLRALASLGLAGLAGALVVVILGWPRGDAAPPEAGFTGADRKQQVLLSPSGAASPASAEQVVVDVDGRVRRPGIVELPAGSRVVDAIEGAGGALPAADTGALNLAQVLVDGEQVVVPSRSEGTALTDAPVAGPTAPTTPGGSGLVSLNAATETELETLPGIGPVLAAAIVEWRSQNGGFTTIEQLQDVSGIGPATFAELAPLVRL